MQRLIFNILLMSCLLFSVTLGAQRVLVHEEPDTSGEIPMYGKNRAMYVHGLMKIGIIAPIYETGAQTNYFSTSLSYEARAKAKICSWNAFVLDFGYRCDRFVITQNVNKQIPGLFGNHKRERISIHNLSFAFCDRFNFGRRGNILGIYLDVGFYGDYAFRAAHLYVDEFYNTNSSVAQHTVTRVKENQLVYINTLNYGLTTRLGWEWGSFYAMYRMTDLVLDNPPLTVYPDLPKLVIGIEMYATGS